MKTINAEQYRLLSKLGDEPKEDDVIRILFGKSKNQMTLSEINKLDFSKFKMPEATLFPNLIKHKGVLYGKQDLQEMTFGFYVDLLEQAKNIDDNLIALMTLLWRPITKVSYWNRTKAFIAHKLLTTSVQVFRKWGLKLLANVKYEIEDYDPLKCSLREKDFQTMDGSIAAYTINFFLLTSQRLVIDSLRSLKEDLKKKGEALQESLKRISADGAGSPTSGL